MKSSSPAENCNKINLLFSSIDICEQTCLKSQTFSLNPNYSQLTLQTGRYFRIKVQRLVTFAPLSFYENYLTCDSICLIRFISELETIDALRN